MRGNRDRVPRHQHLFRFIQNQSYLAGNDEGKLLVRRSVRPFTTHSTRPQRDQEGFKSRVMDEAEDLYFRVRPSTFEPGSLLHVKHRRRTRLARSKEFHQGNIQGSRNFFQRCDRG